MATSTTARIVATPVDSRLAAIASHDSARHHCEQLYAKWLHARAALYDPDGDMSDAALGERGKREAKAAQHLLAAPSVLPWMIWRKFEVMEIWITEEAADGARTDQSVA